MSGGRFQYMDNNLKMEMFGWFYEDGKVPNVMEDREISELVYDVLDLIHDYDWYASGDTGEDDYLKAKAAFKKKWFSNRGVRVRRIVDESVEELKKELYKTFNITYGET